MIKWKQAPVVQKSDNAIHRSNHYPLDSGNVFPNIYSLDSDLTGPGSRKARIKDLRIKILLHYFVFTFLCIA